MSFGLDFAVGAEEQYLSLLDLVLSQGEPREDRTGVGTKDIFGYQLRVDLSKGFPLLTTKKMFYRGMVEELLWMLRGETHVKPLQDKNVRIWDEWSTPEQCAKFGREPGDLGPIYGFQWRRFGEAPGQIGVDQISAVLHALRTNPFSRRLIVTGWNPRDADCVSLPPCHSFFQFNVRKKDLGIGLGHHLLDCHLYQRSGDLFLGVPFNIASYALLTHIMAGLAGMTPGVLVHSLGNAHIYNNHQEQVREQLGRRPLPLPRLVIETFRHRMPKGKELPDGISASSIYTAPGERSSLYTSLTDPRGWSIDDFLSACEGAEDFKFVDYQSHPPIKAHVAV